MAVLNFPANPTVGQEYEYPPYVYIWDGEKWNTKTGTDGSGGGTGGSQTFVSETAPVGAAPGSIWFCSLNGLTYILYQDVDSTAWVESSPSTTVVAGTASGGGSTADLTGAVSLIPDGTDILAYFKNNPTAVFRTGSINLLNFPSGWKGGTFLFMLGDTDGLVATRGVLLAFNTDTNSDAMFMQNLNNGTWSHSWRAFSLLAEIPITTSTQSIEERLSAIESQLSLLGGNK